jgi:phosphoglycolate phosphatase
VQYSAVTFDLDGTLLDTLDDIADSANQVLAGFGFPTHAPASYRDLIGEGLSLLYERALPPEALDEELVAQCTVEHRAIYQENWNAKTRPYDGIVKLIEQLTQRGVKSAVLSNKPDHFTQLCIHKFFAAGTFEVVFGAREHIPPKPDPAGAIEIADRMKLPSHEFIFLGDTKVDMQTACNSGMLPVGALWGFRSRDELQQHGARALVEHPRELIAILEGESSCP